MNNCTFIGRIGRDAVTRFTAAGKPVTGWSMAVDTGFGDNKQTTWLDCSGWGERYSKIAEYIRKGDRIGVAGEIGTREHEGKFNVTLNVREVTLLGEKRDGAATKPARTSAQIEKADADEFGDEIPF